MLSNNKLSNIKIINKTRIVTTILLLSFSVSVFSSAFSQTNKRKIKRDNYYKGSHKAAIISNNDLEIQAY